MKNEITKLLNWLKPKIEDQDDIEERANVSANFYKTYFESDLKRMMLEELLRKDTFEETNLEFHKGVLSGLDIIKKYFEEKQNISLSDEKDEEDE